MDDVHTMLKPAKRSLEWGRLSTKIKDAGKTGMCTRPDGIVDDTYIAKALDHSDVVFYTEDARGISAFLMARFKDSVMETLLVCSAAGRGSGKAVVQKSLAYARSRRMTHATLHALPHVAAYYPKFGYVRNETKEIINARKHGIPYVKNLSNLKNWHATHTTTPNQVQMLRPSSTSMAPTPTPLPKRKKKTKKALKPQDIVWAYVPGYPHWPAQVKEFSPPKPGKIYVVFYGTNKYAWIRPKDAVLYTGKEGQHYTAARSRKESDTKQKLLDAIDQADKEYLRS